MRQKGQLSFDVFFAVIFAMLLVQQLLFISGQMNDSARNISLHTQSQIIANNIAGIISSAGALSDGNFSITYSIPKILDNTKTMPQDCNITINETQKKVIVSYDGIGDANAFYDTPLSDNKPIAATKCGQILKIERIVE